MKRTHWFARARLSMIGALSLFGCATSHDAKGGGEQTSPTVWEAAYTPTPPVIDGRIDAVWDNAQPLIVMVREALGGGAPKKVILRALFDADRIYVLAQWPDRTRSDMRDPYVWDPVRKEYDRPTEPDDQFALEFPLSGDFKINMLTTSEFVADVWHWKAGRGNPAGWVDDKRHLIGKSAGENALVYELGGHKTVHIARPLDKGTRSYAIKKKPALEPLFQITITRLDSDVVLVNEEEDNPEAENGAKTKTGHNGPGKGGNLPPHSNATEASSCSWWRRGGSNYTSRTESKYS